MRSGRLSPDCLGERDMDMTDKVVLITGASRGIGAAAAREFAAAGAKVALLARNGDAIATLAGEIGAAGIAIPCDVSRYWEVAAAVTATVETFGRLDVAVANAGVLEPIAYLAETDPEAWGHAVDINLKGAFHVMRAALPAMLEAGGGTLIGLSSGAAHTPEVAWSSYCAAKAGAYMLTRMVDAEYRSRGIRALGLRPSTVATDMQRIIAAHDTNPDRQVDWSEHFSPEWPAKALVWMCGPAADAYLGTDVYLRDPDILAAIGLT